MPTLEIRNLECLRREEPVFENLSFAVAAGTVVQILGANGSGKTSLLRLLAGLSQPSAGDILWNGCPLAGQLSEWRYAMTYLSHSGGVTPNLTVTENLAFAVALAGRGLRTSLVDALAAVGLANRANDMAARLSAGQRQRVALARLVAIPATVWLLDEPLTALDADGKQCVEVLLAAHAASGGIALVATHQPLALEAATLRTLALDGRAPA